MRVLVLACVLLAGCGYNAAPYEPVACHGYAVDSVRFKADTLAAEFRAKAHMCGVPRALER